MVNCMAMFFCLQRGKTAGLPLPRQKNLLNIAFPAPKFRRGGDFNAPDFYFYTTNNQQYTKLKLRAEGQFLGLKSDWQRF